MHGEQISQCPGDLARLLGLVERDADSSQTLVLLAHSERKLRKGGGEHGKDCG